MCSADDHTGESESVARVWSTNKRVSLGNVDVRVVVVIDVVVVVVGASSLFGVVVAVVADNGSSPEIGDKGASCVIEKVVGWCKSNSVLRMSLTPLCDVDPMGMLVSPRSCANINLDMAFLQHVANDIDVNRVLEEEVEVLDATLNKVAREKV